jgi:hypothetical protein
MGTPTPSRLGSGGPQTEAASVTEPVRLAPDKVPMERILGPEMETYSGVFTKGMASTFASKTRLLPSMAD